MDKNRRQFFINGLRAGALGLIGAAAGGAVIKRRRLLREGKCLNKSICCNCKVFDDCGLPAALSAKAKGRRS